MDNILEVVLRSLVVYLFMIVAVRLMGKKELSQLNTADLILILLISNAVQNAMVGADTSLLGGITAAASLFVLNYFLKLLFYKNPKLRKIIEGEPIVLIYKGQVNHSNLEKERITLSELKEAIREHGFMEIKEIGLAMLEQDGNISVIADKQLIHQKFSQRKRGLPLRMNRKK